MHELVPKSGNTFERITVPTYRPIESRYKRISLALWGRCEYLPWDERKQTLSTRLGIGGLRTNSIKEGAETKSIVSMEELDT